ncbi:hypothetical protein Fleli_2544 [Bernardetia litoralis DSM 6794]|uniref:Lipoprotein n=1 Tax=Bernardetia litoralis (strain ATCC 23117 / DSM 6794 / NBRC 15988 / NCIMB 1366 / Fx l1 / Sio-4) TaxID=880071 RepID=I4ALS4_BERLS|nr:hypothetical protein [Bernardetia litoralis]AFM04909.1 hypothetical protein Fleli_2544 [Bernardetia litoralis DSM 6794]
MKNLKFIFLLFSFLFFSCSLDNSSNEKIVKNSYRNYINPNYLKCLENNLPCECYTAITSVKIDSNYLSVFGGGIEPFGYSYEIKNDTLFTTEKNEYVGENDETILVENQFIDYIILKNDSLLFYNREKKVLLIAFEGDEYDSLDVYEFQHKVNLDFLIKKFKDTDFVNDLSINENTSLSCNPMKGVNLLWNKPPQKTWIVEKENDSLFIYQDLSSPNLSHPIIVEKQFYKKYKW